MALHHNGVKQPGIPGRSLIIFSISSSRKNKTTTIGERIDGEREKSLSLNNYLHSSHYQRVFKSMKARGHNSGICGVLFTTADLHGIIFALLSPRGAGAAGCRENTPSVGGISLISFDSGCGLKSKTHGRGKYGLEHGERQTAKEYSGTD